MMNLALVLASALALGARSQELPVDARQLASLSDAKEWLKSKLAPAKADPAAVRKLMDRLSKDGAQEPTEEGAALSYVGRDPSDPASPIYGVKLYEVPAPSGKIGGKDSPYQDLVYRRRFSHMEGVTQEVRRSEDGGAEIQEWKYTLALDGTIVKVEHNVVVVARVLPDGSVVADPKRSKSASMSPKDPAVLQRWRKMEKTFLLLGPTLEA